MCRLEYLRRARGLSQQALGERIHYSGPMICRLERHLPDAMTVNRRLRAALEGYFNEPLEKLLSPVEVENKATARLRHETNCA